MTLKNKKGIAPLIATVILVAFAVSLGALVINWNRQYVEDIADFSRDEGSTSVACSFDLGLAITDVKGERQICIDNNNNILLTLENNKRNPIEEVRARITTNESIYGPMKIDKISGDGIIEGIEGGYAQRGIINESEFNGTIKQILIIPGIDVDGNTRFCFDNSISVEGPLNECE